jgi:pimeloyl-ACP methyl ester carboxylesterase
VTAAPFPAPHAAAPRIVYVIDGAGGFEATSRTIRETALADGLPLEVRSFHWTHGYCRILADQMHAAHMRREGQRLAELVMQQRQQSPGQPISLVGHSAGCGLVLVAAEHLPPNSLDRIILMAPAVSVGHDLRPALASARHGMDVFCSDHDWACLSIGVCLAGTTDRRWTLAAAGKVGFRPTGSCSGDAALYSRLRQYPWDASLAWTGHRGGHYGSYQPGFLRVFVFPLLCAP